MKNIILILCLGYGTTLAQINENFSSGLLINWVGDTADFEVDTNYWLHLIAEPVSGKSYLSIPSEAIDSAQWELAIRMKFNPSGSNYSKVHLVSDRADLNNDLNGYFLKIGGSSDEVSLYRQDGSNETELIDGRNDLTYLSFV